MHASACNCAKIANASLTACFAHHCVFPAGHMTTLESFWIWQTTQYAAGTSILQTPTVLSSSAYLKVCTYNLAMMLYACHYASSHVQINVHCDQNKKSRCSKL